jgi:hypothetical protein
MSCCRIQLLKIFSNNLFHVHQSGVLGLGGIVRDVPKNASATALAFSA